MNRIVALIFLLAGIGLLILGFLFFQTSQKLEREVDTLRELRQAQMEPMDEIETNEAEPETPYDPTDIDQTPPGITPFIFGSTCAFNWGLQMRQYCESGDGATLDTVEGITRAEVMKDITMCLNEMIQRIDTYDDPNLRYIDSEVPLNEANRKALACEMTGLYGDSPVFDLGSIGYMIKEHVESGNISRLENR